MVVGYRVGEPQETNAKKLIEFEVVESGNVAMLDYLAAALHCEPTLESIQNAIDKQFGADAIGMWLCDSPEWAVERYGPGEAYSVEVPSYAIIGTDLGPDGKLWIWRKATIPPENLERVCSYLKPKGVQLAWIFGSSLYKVPEHDLDVAVALTPTSENKRKFDDATDYGIDLFLLDEGGNLFSVGLDDFLYSDDGELEDLDSVHAVRIKCKGNPTVFVEIHMLKDAPAIIGSDMNVYGPFLKGRVYAIPKENARIFIKTKIAVATRKEAKKPTLKEMFKGEVLTPYIEAALVTPLVPEEEPKLKPEETGKLADYFLTKLDQAGIVFPSRFKSEFEEAMDPMKTYRQNLVIMDELVNKIAKRPPLGKKPPLFEKDNEVLYRGKTYKILRREGPPWFYVLDVKPHYWRVPEEELARPGPPDRRQALLSQTESLLTEIQEEKRRG